MKGENCAGMCVYAGIFNISICIFLKGNCILEMILCVSETVGMYNKVFNLDPFFLVVQRP